jgi:hypothetical protein
MRYRELVRMNGPLTLFAVSGLGVLRALRYAERAGLRRARPHDGTYVVEINRGADELPTDPARWPAALTTLAQHADVRLQRTPGRPTMCLSATARSGQDGRADLGRRVRETKQILETGEVLRCPAAPSASDDEAAGDGR